MPPVIDELIPASRCHPFGRGFLLGCIARWHDIPQGNELDDQQVDYFVVVIDAGEKGR